MTIAVVGATGMVGSVMLQVLAERKLAITELLLVASSRNKGKEMEWEGKKYVVKDLKDNKVIAWFQDKSEFGPRALGNRSLLVNPIFDNKDYLNSKVKYREYWRPYAPMVIEEETKHWFDLPVDKSPHMLFNSSVVKDKRKQIPSVVHVDGSARVQTVSKNDNKKIYMLNNNY